MRVGIVDLGGNTARLLVAELGPDGLERVLTERVVLGLGATIEWTGGITKSRLAAAEATVKSLSARAYACGCDHVEVLVTSPGRQSTNRKALERALTGGPKRVRFVTAEDEAELAYAGAVACTPTSPGAVAVCDVGGGSTELAVGSPTAAPSWCRSLDLGSLRLTRRHFRRSRPREREIEAARAVVRKALVALTPAAPAVTQVLASGGTARAVRKLVGTTLGPDELAVALEILRRTEPRKVARRYGLPLWRAEVLAGGTVVLAEIQALLGIPLTVSGGGFRDGAALQLLGQDAAAA